jgi:adenosylcobinamide-phosphate synthase
MTVTLTLAALLIEALVGYPDRLVRSIGHPVSWIGRLIGALERYCNRDTAEPVQRRALGIITLLLVVTVVAVAAFVIERGLLLLPFGVIGVGFLASALIAQRSLHEHVADVADALEKTGAEGGRAAVSHIVGRDTEALDEAGVARAAIESLAENFSDGVVAPVFWMLIAGLPGAAVYKAINTADSMIGHRTPRYQAFGWSAARLDALHHRSPNAGYPEAAMAGALGLALAGPRNYGGVRVDDALMGNGRRAADANDIRRALGLYRRADGLLIAFVAMLAVALIATA